MKGQVLREGIQEDSERHVLRFTLFQENLILIFQLLATFISSNDYFFQSEKNSVDTLAFPLHPYILLGELSLLVTRKGQPYRLCDFIICQWCLVQG